MHLTDLITGRFTRDLSTMNLSNQRHDQITPVRIAGAITPVFWENVKPHLQQRWAYLLFELLDKRHARENSRKNNIVVNARGIIKVLGNCDYMSMPSELTGFWVIDYRIYNFQGDA